MTATERINALLKRAGRPALRALDPERDAPGRMMDFTENMDAIVEAEHSDSRIRYIRHLVDVIDQLENALEGVMAERDALMQGIRGNCDFCKHRRTNYKEEPCVTCLKVSAQWEWRGMPEKEETTCRKSQ